MNGGAIAEHVEIVESAVQATTGRPSRHSEDAFLLQIPLCAVTDGMGGDESGAIAARAVIRELAAAAADIIAGRAAISAAFARANDEVLTRARTEPELEGVAATATAALFAGCEIRIVHVGDSRAYLLRGGKLTRLTRDHSIAADLVRGGEITADQAEDHPQRSTITRGIGITAQLEVDEFTYASKPRDLFLLCTDGLTKAVDEPAISAHLAAPKSLASIATGLVDAAQREAAPGDITLILARLGSR